MKYRSIDLTTIEGMELAEKLQESDWEVVAATPDHILVCKEEDKNE